MAVYAIGDVQGCFDELRLLLETIEFDTRTDKLWFCGDLVNRGPDSLRTLEFIHSLGDAALTVLGNHDLHLLATYYHHRKPGRKDTLDELLHAPNAPELMEWLRRQPLIHRDDNLNVSMIHAGLHPVWDIEQVESLAREVEDVLQGDDHIGFYKHMYGDKPRRWSESLSGWQRIRFITNIFTRVRYFDEKLNTALGQKGAPGQQKDGLTPWFDISDRATANERIVFGHWSTLTLVEREYVNVYPIDNGCLWGGRLTALRLDTEPFQSIEIDCMQQQSPDAAK